MSNEFMTPERANLLDGISVALSAFEAKHGTGAGTDVPRQRPDLKLLSFDDDRDPDVIDAVIIDPDGVELKPPPDLKVIADTTMALNDRFRRSYPDEDPSIPGFKITSEVIKQCGPAVQAEIERMVADYDDFDLSDTEHGYGHFDHPKGEVIFHVDCFENEDCQAFSEHPEDLSRSYRVLTIIFASEAA